MANPLLLAALASGRCIEVAPFASWWGKAFIILAFVTAIVQIGLSCWALILETKKQPESSDRRYLNPEKVLDSLKGVLEALANLPAWIAVFLAGLALLWIANETSGKCASLPAAEMNTPA